MAGNTNVLKWNMDHGHKNIDTTRPWTLKPYHELECPQLKQIRTEVIDWLKKNIPDYKTKKGFWHRIDYKDLARKCPSILEWCKFIRVPAREISVALLTEAMAGKGVPLHVGAKPLIIKINVPICNTNDVYTEWYDIPQDVLNGLPITKNPFGESIIDLDDLDNTVADTYPRIVRYEMSDYPIIFNSQIPHRVVVGKNATFPRILISIIPIKDPVHFLGH